MTIKALDPTTEQQTERPGSDFAVLRPLDLDHAGVRPVPIRGVVDVLGDLVRASGIPLLTNGTLGVDLLHVPPGARFPLHRHPGDHCLLVLEGNGTFTLDGVLYTTYPGDLMMVEGGVPHAVGAGPDGHVLLSFGSPHTPLDSPRRMTVVLEDADECAETIRESMKAAGISTEPSPTH